MKSNTTEAINMSNNTAVQEKDLPNIPEPTFVNAPEDLESAVQRILETEMVLEDLVRSVEIARITGQWNLVDSFCQRADELLAGKIQIEQPDFGPVKIKVVTGTLKDSDAETGRS
jgi:hypothetical protein